MANKRSNRLPTTGVLMISPLPFMCGGPHIRAGMSQMNSRG
jgi:hypothetical protein